MKKKIFVIISISFLLIFMIPSDFVDADVELVMESPTYSGTTYNTLGANGYSYQIVFPFIAQETFTPTKLVFNLKRLTATANDFYFGIYECDLSGWSTSSVPLNVDPYDNGICYGSRSLADVSTGGGLLDLVFDVTTELEEGKCYGFYISARSPGATTTITTLSYVIRTSGVYDELIGTAYTSQRYSGTAWTQDAGIRNPVYQLYGEVGGGGTTGIPARSNSIFSPSSGPGGMIF